MEATIAPLQETETQSLGASHEKSRHDEKTTLRVLVAEDDPAMRAVLAWNLKACGYQVAEAKDGLELVRRLNLPFFESDSVGRQREFDIIVSDIRMPGLSSLQALKILRARDPVTPIILITAFGDQITHFEALEAGANVVLDKPFDIDDPVDLLRRL